MAKGTVDVVIPKVRISASMTEWLVDYVKEEAEKEKRSFSQMIDRLVYEANRYRTGMVKSAPTEERISNKIKSKH